MKEMVTIRSNAFYEQREKDKAFSLHPIMELVIVHTNGYEYELDTKKDQIKRTSKFEELRLLVSPEMLSQLIVELQLHEKKLQSIRENADKLNSLVAYLNNPAGSSTEAPEQA